MCGSVFGEAIHAINGPPLRRFKWNLSLFTAVCAYSIMHYPRSSVKTAAIVSIISSSSSVVCAVAHFPDPFDIELGREK